MLFSISLTAEAVTGLIERDPAAAKAQAERLRELAREASQEMRSLIFELRPAELESDGLLPTLRKHIDVVRRVSHKEIELRDEGYVRQPLALEKELFRIVQEALNNAVKHSEASHIAVSLGTNGGQARMTVEDNGVGFDPADPLIRTRRLGLTSMEERAEALGGTMRIKSKRGKGTRVLVEAPLAE